MLHLVEVEGQRGLALPFQRELEGAGIHVGVAVAVAADPVAHAEERRDRLAEQVFELAIKARNGAEERRPVVTERVLDLVAHREGAEAQQARLPQLGDADPQQRGVGVAVASVEQGVARRQKVGDGEFRVQQAFALHFGGMRGEHRRHPSVLQHLGDPVGRDPGFRHPLKGPHQRSRLGRRVGLLIVKGTPAQVVPIFGDVGQVGKVAEGTGHRHAL